MDPLERDNLHQIEALNQRGGRTLSIVDLIEAGTVDVDMAAYLLTCVANGASFLTAANPGGAGKSTVLANLLNFLPPGTRIVTTSSPAVIAEQLREPPAEPTCVLAHEIGSGHWFGYIWGDAVRQYFQLMRGAQRIGSCQHADTMEELSSILRAPPLCVAEDDMHRLDLALFMSVDGGWARTRRRVCAVHEATGSGHRKVFTWRQAEDRFDMAGPSALLPRLAERQGKEAAQVQAELPRAGEFIAALVSDGVRDFERMRERVIAFYRA